MSGRALAGAARIALVAAVVIVILVARVVVSARAELADGEARLAAGETDEAIERLGRAARLDAPGNPYSARALARLAELAAAAESRGDRPGALTAWREVRSAILATRSVLIRHQPLRLAADARIAALSAALESPSVDPGADQPSREKWHAARLAQDDAPSPAWSLAALLGLGLWLGGAVLLLTRGFDRALRVVRAPALIFAACVGLGFALFLLSLSRA